MSSFTWPPQGGGSSSVNEYANGNLGASPTINFGASPAQSGVLSANATAILSGGSSGQTYILRVIQASTGGPYTLSLTGVAWPAGIAPTISTGAAAVDIISLYYSGTNWYGTISQNFS